MTPAQTIHERCTACHSNCWVASWALAFCQVLCVPQIKPTVNDGQLAVQADPFEGWCREPAQIPFDQGGIRHLLDVVYGVINGVIQRQFYEQLPGQNASQLATEGGIVRQPSAAMAAGRSMGPRILLLTRSPAIPL